VAEPDSYSATGGVTLVVTAQEGVLANDSDPDGDTLTASLVSGPTNGTLTLRPDGSFDYTASGDFFGRATFTYQVTAGGESDTALVEIIVN
jgi:hypothetical protein